MLNVKNLHILGLGLLLISGCSRNEPPAEIEFRRAPTIYHIVAPGDSIASIARQYDMDRQLLIDLNQLELPYRLVVGQKLIISPSSSRRDPQSPVLGGGPINVDEYEERLESNEAISPTAPTVPFYNPDAPPSGVTAEDVPPPTDTESMAPPSELLAEEEETEQKKPVAKTEAQVPSKPGGYQWPLRGQVIKTFQAPGKDGKSHDGLNIVAPRGTPVRASNNGQVVHASNQARGFGNVVLIKHNDGNMSAYAHLHEITVKKGDMVKQGDKIGTVGNTGNVKQTQLHFEIRKGTKPIDPKIVLPKG